MPPATAHRSMQGGTYAALDHLTVMQAAGLAPDSAVPMLVSVPHDFSERFAAAFVQVIHKLRDAEADEGTGGHGARQPATERALKMLLLLPALLLRATRADKVRVGKQLAARFAAWEAGDYDQLVAHWERDCSWHAARAFQSSQDADERLHKRVLALIAKGKVSDARRLLESLGVADIARPEVLAQMAAKHPVRTADVDDGLADRDDLPRVVISPEDIVTAFRSLDTDKAAGASTWRYEYLIALVPTVPFPSIMAADAAHSGAYFATRFANNLLPAWFNFVFSSVRLLALRKCTPGVDGREDARPVGIGCALRRAVSKAVVSRASHKALAAGYFAPQQLGVAVPSGGTKLVLSVRELLDADPTLCIVAVDVSNAFNSVRGAGLRGRRQRRGTSP
ncbi:hypothetical protein KFE25_013602 [Diacronema lutheri]|uniref:Reverse transcriptase domain-containing protein n=1 Tax=Diacronema lutheri TaxID=2081491 RepID=A0A8J6CDE6_DIALT|nr:hypothetical protein KFE25_013602 [Diacronema lutheri]